MARNGNGNGQIKGELKPVMRRSNGSVLFSNGMVRTPVARLSFVNLQTPREQTNDDGSTRSVYSCVLLFPKGEDLTLLRLACERFQKELGSKGQKLTRKSPLRMQDEKVDDYQGFVKGAYFMNTTTKFKMRPIDRDKNEIGLDSFYSGCYARVTLRPYYYSQRGNSGIGLGLSALQFIRDGESLGGGGIDPQDAFDRDESENIDDVEDLT